MKKSSLVVVFILFIGTLFPALAFLPAGVRGLTLYVGGAGPGNYTTIQAGIDDADPGDTVYVYSGTFYEVINVNKTLSLMGENKDSTIIDGDGVGVVVVVSADWVNISGFTVRNSGQSLDLFPHFAGMWIDSVENCHIANSNISDNELGVLVTYSRGVVIADSIVSLNHKDGIHISHSDNNTISGNDVSRNWRDGILIFNSNDNAVMNNTVSSNADGIDIGYSDDNIVAGNIASLNGGFGARVYYSSRTSIANNEFSANSERGILLETSEYNVIDNNTFSNSYYGIFLDDTSMNTITSNLILNNTRGIWVSYLSSSSYNEIYHNAFVNNSIQAYDVSLDNRWHNGYPSGGNYWSGYGGFDEKSGPYQDQKGSDGIGDTRYGIPGHTKEDRYPLMNPTIDIPFSPPSRPENLIVTAGNRQATLTWAPPASDGGFPVIRYRIYHGLMSWEEVFVGEIGNRTTFTHYGLNNERTYYYKVSARNIIGEGPRSDEAFVTPYNQIPTCNVTSPSPGATVSGIHRITGTANDTDGTVVSVEIRIGMDPWKQANGTTPWYYDWNTTAFSNGNHTIYVRSFDGEIYSDIANIRVNVDNPTLPPSSKEAILEQAWFWIMVASVIIVVMAVLFILVRRRKQGQARNQTPETRKPLS